MNRWVGISIKLVCVLLLNTTQVSASDELARTVSVTGTAVMKTIPDVVVWSIRAEDVDQDLMTAKARSDDKMKKILALQKTLGIKPQDIQTGHLNVQKVYAKDRYGNRTVFKHFMVTRSVTIKQRKLHQFDDFLTQLLSAAELDVRFEFASSCLHELHAETRLQAIAAAKAKAEAMSSALGAKCVRVLTISETPPPGAYPRNEAYGSAFVDGTQQGQADVAAETFAPGAIEVRIRVYVVFELE